MPEQQETREYLIQRLTLPAVNDHVNDLEERLRRVEKALGLRDEQDELDESDVAE